MAAATSMPCWSLPPPSLRCSVVLRDISIRGKDISLRGPKGSGADFELTGLTARRRCHRSDRTHDHARQACTGRAPAPRCAAFPTARSTGCRCCAPQPSGRDRQRLSAVPPQAPRAAVEGRRKEVERRARRSPARGSGGRPERQGASLGDHRHGAQRGQRRERARRDHAANAIRQRRHAVRQRWCALEPLASDLRVDARSLDVSAVRPYLAARPERHAGARRIVGARPRDGRQAGRRAPMHARLQGKRPARQPAPARCARRERSAEVAGARPGQNRPEAGRRSSAALVSASSRCRTSTRASSCRSRDG